MHVILISQIINSIYSPKQVENLVSIELAYINTKHPDFTEAGLVHRALTDGLREDMHRMKLQDQTNKQQDENRVGTAIC